MVNTLSTSALQLALCPACVPIARGELPDRGVCGDSKDNGHLEAALEGDRRDGMWEWAGVWVGVGAVGVWVCVCV